MSPKISDYATQHAEAGYEEKVKNQKKEKIKNVISLISDFLFRFCLSMLCSIVANFGTHPLGQENSVLLFTIKPFHYNESHLF